MEDLDADRVVPGSADAILRILDAFGLHCDGEVQYQSRRTAGYAEALAALRARGMTFECSCSRRELASDAGPSGRYPGTCRSGPRRGGPTATRFKMTDAPIAFEDRFQGLIEIPAGSLGDVIVRRRDGIFAYQLAVVVDDALQGVTDVVRGADLLESTGWQIALQRSLGLSMPRYGHLPLLTEPGGGKLAKARHTVALDPARAGEQLWTVLGLLRQAPPRALASAPPAQLLAWAVEHWNPDAFRLTRRIELAR